MSYLRQGSYLPGVNTNFTTSSGSQVTAAVANATSIVRVSTTEAVYVEIGANPTASSSSMMIPSGGTEFFAVTPGTSKIAVLQVTTSGVASVTELAILS
jgi:hypothetical protein